MMEKKIWLWKHKSSDRNPGETGSTRSISSNSERNSDEQDVLKESPNHDTQSPEITSVSKSNADNVNGNLLINSQSPEVTSKAAISAKHDHDGSLREGVDDTKGGIQSAREGDANDRLWSLSEKLSAALVNVSAKEDLVKQHAKVAEEAIAGWEKAENEMAVLKHQLEAAARKNSSLEDHVAHLDGALKACVRQLRQTREEQEEKIHEAVERRSGDLESAKHKLENQLLELQSKLASVSGSPTPADLDLRNKVESLEKENMALKNELQYQLEELEIRTIERDLSTQAAETASKQHLDSIKKVAKLEAECRKLKAMAWKSSSVNDHRSTAASSFCVESLTDSHSDSGERLHTVDSETCKTNCSGPNQCEPSCSDSWASALIAELDQFKNEKTRNLSASVETDIMDDFLEMERLASLPDIGNKSDPPVIPNQCINKETSLQAELDTMIQEIAELKEKLAKVEREKAELRVTLVKSEDYIGASQLRLREAEMKLEKLQKEINVAVESNQKIENEIRRMESEAQTLSANIDSLEAEVDRESVLSAEISVKFKELEELLQSKKEEEKLRQKAILQAKVKIKQEDLAVAAGKLAECQETIASLGKQLKSLATLEDFLIDTANLPELSAREQWNLHSNETFSPRRDSNSSIVASGSFGSSANKNEENSPASSSSTTNAGFERSRNGFAKFFSRTKSGIRLEI